MTFLRRPPRPLAAVLLLLVPLVCVAAETGAPLTIDEIESLLAGGLGERVILKQIRTTGTRLTLTVEGLLRLKAAGASDSLLEALLEPPEPPLAKPPQPEPAVPAAPGRAASHIRIYTSENERGQTVVHITNLDAAGRRLGGELSEEERARRNVVEPPEPPPAIAYVEPPPEPAAGGGPPVIVNVYPPEPPPSPYGGGYYGGVYPGLLVGGFHGFVPSRQGHLVRPHRSHFYPPGSYTHYLRYHHTAVTPGRAPILRVDPYTAGNARARNRDAFRRR